MWFLMNATFYYAQPSPGEIFWEGILKIIIIKEKQNGDVK